MRGWRERISKMPWYAAHAVLLVVFRDGHQDRFPVWENIYLMEAESVDAAFAAAESSARAFTDVRDDTMTWEGRSAYWEFKGIRKLITCDVDKHGNLFSGAEATYCQMSFKDAGDLRKFLDDETVNITWEG